MKIKKIRHNLGHLFISGMYHSPFLPNCIFALLLTNAYSNSLSRDQLMGRCELRLWRALSPAANKREYNRLDISADHIPRMLAGGRGLPLTKPRAIYLF